MIVIKVHNGEITKSKYPAMWGNKVVDLDSEIEYYEIVLADKPPYNPNQFATEEHIQLTDIYGTNKLKIANITYPIIEKSEAQIINFLNQNLGEYLDSEQPLWKRVRDNTTANDMRWDIGKDQFTAKNHEDYDFIKSVEAWEKKCRKDRDNYEKHYKNTGTLQEVVYDVKPVKVESNTSSK